MVTPPRVTLLHYITQLLYRTVSIWALGPRFARLVAQRSALMGASLFSIQRFQGGLRLWLRRPESWVESEQDTQRLLNQVSHSFGSGVGGGVNPSSYLPTSSSKF